MIEVVIEAAVVSPTGDEAGIAYLEWKGILPCPPAVGDLIAFHDIAHPVVTEREFFMTESGTVGLRVRSREFRQKPGRLDLVECLESVGFAKTSVYHPSDDDN